MPNQSPILHIKKDHLRATHCQSDLPGNTFPHFRKTDIRPMILRKVWTHVRLRNYFSKKSVRNMYDNHTMYDKKYFTVRFEAY